MQTSRENFPKDLKIILKVDQSKTVTKTRC